MVHPQKGQMLHRGCECDHLSAHCIASNFARLEIRRSRFVSGRNGYAVREGLTAPL